MAAVKPLVGALAVLLLCAGTALADKPTVRINQADQQRAIDSLLSTGDLATGWQGGRTKTHALTAPNCPGFDPKESDLVVTGHADASFNYPSGPVSFDQDVQVLHSVGAVRTDFARTITSKFPGCLGHQLRGAKDVISAVVKPIDFSRVGTMSAAFRASLTLRNGAKTVKLFEDFVFFGVGRTEYALAVLAPAGLESQLEPFETSMAKLLAKRAVKVCC